VIGDLDNTLCQCNYTISIQNSEYRLGYKLITSGVFSKIYITILYFGRGVTGKNITHTQNRDIFVFKYLFILFDYYLKKVVWTFVP